MSLSSVFAHQIQVNPEVAAEALVVRADVSYDVLSINLLFLSCFFSISCFHLKT